MARWLASILALTAGTILLGTADAQTPRNAKLDVEAVFKKLDSNGDGKLTKDEFLRLADRFKDRAKAREKLTLTYRSIDPTNAGLSKGQFSKYLEEMKKKDTSSRK